MSVNIFGSSNKSNSTNVTKNYVDSKFITLTNSSKNKLDKNGDTMTGDLNMENNNIKNVKDPIDNEDSVNRKYVHELGLQYWGLNGNTANRNVKFGTLDNFNVELVRNNQECMTFRPQRITVKKDLDMSNCKIYNLLDPGHGQSAVNKLYVDALFEN